MIGGSDISPGHLFKELLRAEVAGTQGHAGFSSPWEVTSPCLDQRCWARLDYCSQLSPLCNWITDSCSLLCDLQYFSLWVGYTSLPERDNPLSPSPSPLIIYVM